MADLSGLRDAQARVGQFVETHNLDAPVSARALDLASEVGEIAKEVLKGSDYGRRTFKPPDGWIGEIADALFALFCLANSTGVDLDSALETVLVRYTARLAARGSAGSGT